MHVCIYACENLCKLRVRAMCRKDWKGDPTSCHMDPCKLWPSSLFNSVMRHRRILVPIDFIGRQDESINCLEHGLPSVQLLLLELWQKARASVQAGAEAGTAAAEAGTAAAEAGTAAVGAAW